MHFNKDSIFQRLALVLTLATLISAAAAKKKTSTTTVLRVSTSFIPKKIRTTSSTSSASPTSSIDTTTFYELEISDGLANSEDQSRKIVKTPFQPPPGILAVPSLPSQYVFNATDRKNVVVYFGQTPGTKDTNLTNQCNDPNIDIVILGFVRIANGSNGYPNATFGTSCTKSTTGFTDAPGLIYCDKLAPQISFCQSIGKKVFVSLGGSVSNLTLYSDAQAISFANTLWNLFGGGTQSPSLRPFGSVSIDGFDLDNETKDNGSRYGLFARTMRSLYSTDSSKKYYLSATATCTWNDALLTTPIDYMTQCDFIFPRFYNNLKCNINTGYFFNATKGNPGGMNWWSQWAQLLGPSGPKIFIGGLAYQTNGSGYLPPDNFAHQILNAKNESMLGGVMLWDGTQAHLTMNQAGTLNFVQVIKAALSS